MTIRSPEGGQTRRAGLRLGLFLSLLLATTLDTTTAHATAPQDTDPDEVTEDDYYRLSRVPVPEGVVLEVGGMTTLPSGDLAVATRRGEVWIVKNPYADGDARPHFTRFAHGLHTALGLAYLDGDLYAAQRGELTRLRDTNGDGVADRYETVYAWPLSGNYHEYSFGPVISPTGGLIVTLNLAWVGHGASLVKWRGWALDVTPGGDMTPVAVGMRGPAGFGYNLEGDLFYAENQGDWIGSGYISHVETGDFLGNPQGLVWTDEPESPLRLSMDDVPNTGDPMVDVVEKVPGLKLPAVWFPHGILGISTSGILVDSTGGAFGPFGGQLFVGDQGHSKIFRVALERVDGVYQGAVFPFRDGFSSGVLRQVWGADGSMFVGMTNRGWGSTGRDPYGLERLVWTGEVPFEAERIEARPDGLEIFFTLPADPASAGDPAAYDVTGFTYMYHGDYGSPPIRRQSHAVRGVVVSDSGLSARLVIDGMREGYIHEVKMAGVRSADGMPLLHDAGYYTLNRIPAGEPAVLAEMAEAPAEQDAGGGEASAEDETSPDTSVGTVKDKRQTFPPASWSGSADEVVSVGVEPGLIFSVTEVAVAAGSQVELVFNNTDDMAHNLVITLPGMANAVGEAAIALGLDGAEMDWVPASDDVLYHTGLLEPGGSETIYFTAPTEPGEYDFVCTFPGHHGTMRGVLRVTS